MASDRCHPVPQTTIRLVVPESAGGTFDAAFDRVFRWALWCEPGADVVIDFWRWHGLGVAGARTVVFRVLNEWPVGRKLALRVPHDLERWFEVARLHRMPGVEIESVRSLRPRA